MAILEAAGRTTTADGHGMAVGIGVHAGETVATEEGYVGSVVNIAARVCAIARPGELLVTDAVRSLTRSYLDVGFVPSGRRRLKGISERIGIYRVVASREAAQQNRRRANALWQSLAVVGGLAAVVLLVSFGLRAPPPGEELAGSSAGAGAHSMAPRSSSPAATVAVESAAGTDVAFPNPAERALLSRIDDGVARHCERPDQDEIPIHTYGSAEATYSGPMAVEAGLRCSLGSSSEPDTVWFWQPTQSWAADEFFFSVAGRRSVPRGDCATQDHAYGSWDFGDKGGRILCLEGSRDAELYWTYEDDRILGIAVRGDGDVRTIYRWWLDHARILGASARS